MLTLYKYTLRPFWIDWSWLYSFVVTDVAVSKVTGVQDRFFPFWAVSKPLLSVSVSVSE